MGSIAGSPRGQPAHSRAPCRFLHSLCSGEEMEGRRQLFDERLAFRIQPNRVVVEVVREGGLSGTV